MFQIPKIRVGIVAVSRDCSPEKLSVDRRKAVVKACRESQEGEELYECPICIVKIEENSELDLFEACNRHAGDPGIPEVVRDMEEELGEGNQRPSAAGNSIKACTIRADYVRLVRETQGISQICGCCRKMLACVPDTVRLCALLREHPSDRTGIPMSCEADIYGALSKFIGTCVSADAATLLDINNTVPADLYEEEIQPGYGYAQSDVFVGFYCGNTCSGKLTTRTIS